MAPWVAEKSLWCCAGRTCWDKVQRKAVHRKILHWKHSATNHHREMPGKPLEAMWCWPWCTADPTAEEGIHTQELGAGEAMHAYRSLQKASTRTRKEIASCKISAVPSTDEIELD